MKRVTPLLALLCTLLFASLLSACSSGQSSNSSSEPVSHSISVKDMTGKEITLEEPATRVVAVSPSDCEILYALGAGDTLVGRGSYCDYPEQVSEIPVIESGKDLNVEQIMALQPQVVLMTAMTPADEQIKALEAAGTKVVVSEATTIESVYTAIKLVGEVVGKTSEADSLVSTMKSSFEEIKNKATGNGSKTVYFEVSPLEYGLWAAGKNTFMDEIANMLGLTNAFANLDGWAQVSEEQVIERNPDYIVTIAMYFGEGVKPTEEISKRPGWENMKAIKNNALFNADSSTIARPGPRLVDAAESLYNFVYVTTPQEAAA